jgi:hypothetical protein
MDNWEKYEPGERENYVHFSRWGKDHWSTLAYVECKCVDDNGVLDNRKMRTNPRLHRTLVGVTFGQIQDGSAHPTIARNGEIEQHDDWSCLEDMAAFGLLDMYVRTVKNREVFGCDEAKVELTELGQIVAAELREHKGRGGNFADFEYPNLLCQR